MSDRLAKGLPTIMLAAMLALLSGPAAALGLGQLQVKSQPGQPLVAEIPIISNDPSELQGLQVSLAPPETFARVGLEPPSGDVSALQFQPALDAQGRPVIRVTSAVPLQQPLLKFLVQVDSNGVRVVREVTALLDAPRTVAAPVQPPIQAPVVAPSNTIVRPVQAPVVTAPPAPAAPTPVAPAPTPPAPASAPPVPRPVVTAPQAAPQPVQPAPAPPSPPVAAPRRPGELGKVRPGQTLSEIAAGIRDDAHTLDQTMLALLRSNPDAFIGGNINLLRVGAVLRAPDSAALARYSVSQASAEVREQVASWRQAAGAISQPTASASTNSGKAITRRPAATAPPARNTGARLEIAPPSASGAAKAGTRSGIQAGGEGDMLQQQLQETRETLAARDAEVHDLKSRVAELEKIQQDQQKLLTMKDSELAAAQHNLATANQAQATSATTAQPAAQPQPAASPFGGWIWLLGLALIVAAGGAWLSMRRRKPVTPKPSRGFDTAALAASIPGARKAMPEEMADEARAEARLDAEAEADLRDAPADEAGSMPPAWTTGASVTPTWHGAGLATPAAPTAADVANASQQLQLAKAYLDMGDDDAARELLREVLDGRDPAARTEAARLLRDL